MEKKTLLNEKIWKSNHFLSVEPMLLFFSTAMVMSSTTLQNLLLYAACDDFNYKESKCVTELDSEKTVSKLLMIRSFFMILFWIYTTSCACSLIDRNLKYLRWFLFLPAAGQLVCDVLNLLSVVYFKWSPIVLVSYSLFILGFSGSQIAALLISTTYVSHESSLENRSIKIGYIIFSQTLGQALGNVSGGYVVDLLGFSCAFLLCIVLASSSLFLGLMFIEDLSERDISVQKARVNNFISAASEGFQILYEKRPHKKRTMIILLLIAFVLTHSYQNGENQIEYLFLRNKFGWGAAQFGVLMFYKLCTKAVGTLLSTEILKRKFRFRDATVGIIAASSEIVSHFLWLVIFESWQVYLVPIFGIFESAIQLVSMSLTSKCVEPAEYGRLSSLFALSKLFLPLSTLIYNLVYQSTLRTYPAAIFLISFGLTLPLFLIFGILSRYTKKIPKPELSQAET